MEIRNIGNSKQFLWDDYIIDRSQSTAPHRLMHPIKKGPCFMFDQGAECFALSYPSILKDDAGYKMYYIVWEDEFLPRAYAAMLESKDGIHWERPNLNIIEHPELTANNAVADNLSDAFFVLYDTNPNCKPEEKYKAIASKITENRTNRLWIYTSADGYRFNPIAPLEINGLFDSMNTIHYANGRYVCYSRNGHSVSAEESFDGNTFIRDIQVSYSDDFIHWSEPERIRYEDGLEIQMYTNNVMPYPGNPDVLVGFPTRYWQKSTWTKNFDELLSSELKQECVKRSYNAGDLSGRGGLAQTDAIFMFSYDGKLWKRYNQAFLTPGYENDRNWVYGDCYFAYGLVDSGNESYYMYAHECHRSQDAAKPFVQYEIRKDGFACVIAEDQEEVVVTKPLIFEGDDLYINFETSCYGYMYISVLGPDGTELAEQESYEIFGNHIERRVCFENGANFSAFAGQPIRLKIRMRDAKLYSLQFK